jgi:hypothetical protein
MEEVPDITAYDTRFMGIFDTELFLNPFKIGTSSTSPTAPLMFTGARMMLYILTPGTFMVESRRPSGTGGL